MTNEQHEMTTIEMTSATPTSDIIDMLRREVAMPDHIRGSECDIANHYRDAYLAMEIDGELAASEIHPKALAEAIAFHERQIVCNLIDELAPVCPEQVADKALEILAERGLEAALAEVRRAKAYDAKPGHGNLI